MKIFQKIFTLLFSIILLLCATGLSVLAEESTRVYPEYIEPKEIKKAKSIEELGLADVEDTEEVQLKK